MTRRTFTARLAATLAAPLALLGWRKAEAGTHRTIIQSREWGNDVVPGVPEFYELCGVIRQRFLEPQNGVTYLASRVIV